jgi:energy-coupling factor transport system permease protein
MASPVIFHYNPRETVLHRLDPRLKMLILMTASSVLFFTEGRGLTVFALSALAALYAGRVPPGRLIRGAFPLWIFAVMLFVSRALLTPGLPAGESAFWRALPVTGEGILLGATEALRLVILVFLCHVFICVTPAADIQRAAAFFTGKKAALLIRLSCAMIPDLLDTARGILDALACRGLSFRRRPLHAVMLFGMC